MVANPVVLLPILDTRCQRTWDEIYAVFERQGLEAFLPRRHALEPHHLAELQESGISPVQAAAAGICSVGPIHLERLGMRSREALLVYFYLDPWGAPYTWGEGIPYCRAKLNKPINGQKYTQPKGSCIYPYFPRVSGQSWASALHLGDDGEPTSPYPTLDAIVTEGEKKSLKATLEGFATIGLGGVWNFRGEWGEVHSEFMLAVRQCRSLTLIYDNDAALKPQVAAAANALLLSVANDVEETDPKQALAAVRAGIKPRHPSTYTYWSLLPQTLSGEKLGLDDLLIRPNGREILQALVENRLQAIHTQEEGSAKKGTLKVNYVPTYTPEPFGDDAVCKVLPRNSQEHLRRVLTVSAAELSGIKYIAELGAYEWDTRLQVWRQMPNDVFKGLPNRIADAHKWKNRSGAHIQSCLDAITSNPLRISGFNPRRLVGFANGDLDPVTGQLHDISPANLLTSRLSVDWVPDVGCPTFLAWLHWMWARHPHQVELLRAAIRWTLEPKGDAKFGTEVVVGLIGPAGRGKGSLLEVFQALMGEGSVAGIALAELEDPNTLRRVMGRQALFDSDQKGFLSERLLGTINKIASNEPVSIKQLYRDVMQTRLGAVIWFAANRMPRTPSAAEDNEGWHRRLIPLYCDRKPEQPDPNFLAPILRELPGIVQWCWAMPLDEALGILSQTQRQASSPERIEADLEHNSLYLWLQSLFEVNARSIQGSLTSNINPETGDVWKVALKIRNGRSIHEMESSLYPVRDGAVYLPNWKVLHLDYLCWCEINREKGYGSQRFVEQINLLGGKTVRPSQDGDRVRYRVLSLIEEQLNIQGLVTGA